MPKREAGDGQKVVFALYVLQFRRFRRSGKLIEKGIPNIIQNEPQMEAFGDLVFFINILVGFRKHVFFLACFDRQEVGLKSAKMRFWAA